MGDTTAIDASKAALNAQENAVLKITGGTFTSANTTALVAKTESATANDVYVSGGTFETTNGYSVCVPYQEANTDRITDFDSVLGRYVDADTTARDWEFTDYSNITKVGSTTCIGNTVSAVQGYVVEFDRELDLLLDQSSLTDADIAVYTPLIIPVTVATAEKRLYPQNSLPTASIAPAKAYGTTYALQKWTDRDNINTVVSRDDLLEMTPPSSTVSSSIRTFYAVYSADVTTSQGLKEAMKVATNASDLNKPEPVTMVKLANDITMGREDSIYTYGTFTLNLNGKHITFPTSMTADYGITCEDGTLTIMDSGEDGQITAEKNVLYQACLADGPSGSLAIEGGRFVTTESSYSALRLDDASLVKLTGGTFVAPSHAICLYTELVADSFIADMLGDNIYANNTYTEWTNENDHEAYVSSPYVRAFSEEPRVGVEAEDFVFPQMTYGDTRTDVVTGNLILNITGNQDVFFEDVQFDEILDPLVHVDRIIANAVAEGSSTTDEIILSTAAQLEDETYVDAGTYSGTGRAVYYIVNDSLRDAKYVTVKTSLTIAKKQLTITAPIVTNEKVYDGSTNAVVTTGNLSGVVDGDDVSLTATATYDNADAGTAKTITVKYKLSGADSANYIAPKDNIIKTGAIKKAAGSATVTLSSWKVGEKAHTAAVASSTNGTDDVTYLYKQKDASDDTYTTTVPSAEGSYTVKAVLAATKNYLQAEATSDFTITYLTAPEDVYSLSGTAGKKGWYTSAVTILPKSGYTIAESENGTYEKNIQRNSSTDAITVYFKSSSGAITTPVTIPAVRIDRTKPVITGIKDKATYYTDETQAVVITDENLDTVTVDGVPQTIADHTSSLNLTAKTGTYTVVASDEAGNETKYEVTVRSYTLPTPESAYTIVGTAGTDGWYTSGVQIVPKSGYKITTAVDVAVTDSLSYAESISDVSIYLSDGIGHFTKAISVGEIKIDTTVPSVTGDGEGITVGTSQWKTVVNDITFGRFFTETQTVKMQASDSQSQIAGYEYLVSGTALGLAELQNATGWVKGQSLAVSAGAMQEQIVYGKITNGAGLVSYVSTDGMVYDTQAPVVTGAVDGQVYYNDTLAVEVSDSYLAEVTLDGTSIPLTGTSLPLSITASTEPHTITATDQTGNTVAVTFTVYEPWVRDGISAGGVRTLVTGLAYKLGGGQWTVAGDTTVYQGGTTFYATSDGDVEFQKK